MHGAICNLVRREPYLVVLLVQQRIRRLLRWCLRHAFLSSHGKRLLSCLGEPFCLDSHAMRGSLNELKKERGDGTYRPPVPKSEINCKKVYQRAVTIRTETAPPFVWYQKA